MLVIDNQTTVIEDEVEYIVTTYSNGAVTKERKPIHTVLPDPQPGPLTEMEQTIYDIQANTEYLVCLNELGGE